MAHPGASTDSVPSANRERRGPRFALFGCLAGLFALAGCSERHVEITGKVTVDGKPLTSSACTIMFAPDKDNQLKKIPASGLDQHGLYHIATGDRQGLPLGWYKVFVAFDARESKGKPPPFHRRYLDAVTSPLSVEVVPNPAPGAYDLNLTEK